MDHKPTLPTGQPLKPERADHQPIAFDYGTGKRIAPRSKKNRPKHEIADGTGDDSGIFGE